MTLPEKKDLIVLAKRKDKVKISICLPTHKQYLETDKDRIILKNALSEVEDRLKEKKLSNTEIKKMLQAVTMAQKNKDFWKSLEDGLIFFVSKRFTKMLKVPFSPEQIVMISDHFYLRPLISRLSDYYEVYILAISQDDVRFFYSSPNIIQAIDLPKAPGSISDALKFDVPQKQLQFHTGTASTTNKRNAMFHGHGLGNDERNARVIKYFRDVDREIRKTIKKKNLPLVLACIDYLYPLYKEANNYRFLMSEYISGNPEEMLEEELRVRAEEIVGSNVNQRKLNALSQCRELLGTGLASNDYAEIFSASYHGRIDTLFIANGEHIWATEDSKIKMPNDLEKIVFMQGELLNTVAIQTLLHDGTVYELKRSNIPSESPVLATYRY